MYIVATCQRAPSRAWLIAHWRCKVRAQKTPHRNIGTKRNEKGINERGTEKNGTEEERKWKGRGNEKREKEEWKRDKKSPPTTHSRGTCLVWKVCQKLTFQTQMTRMKRRHFAPPFYSLPHFIINFTHWAPTCTITNSPAGMAVGSASMDSAPTMPLATFIPLVVWMETMVPAFAPCITISPACAWMRRGADFLESMPCISSSAVNATMVPNSLHGAVDLYSSMALAGTCRVAFSTEDLKAL